MHDVLIGPPRDGVVVTSGKPFILQRSDEDFIASTLDELRTPLGRQTLAQRRASAVDGNGTMKLFQPVQRQFHVAVVEAWCDTPGAPRIDPKRIASAGFVVRRVGADGQPEGWMRSNGRVRGWCRWPAPAAPMPTPLRHNACNAGSPAWPTSTGS